MTLTILNAPFGSNPGSFNFERRGPAHVLYFEDSPRRVRVKLAGVIVADSRRMKLLHETGRIVVYYFHKDDIRGDLLVPSDHTSECPFKGTARYWSVRVSDRVAENAVWAYDDPIEGAPDLADYRAFYWNKMDAWFEEDEEVFVHARDPKVRIDILASARPVRVVLAGQTVAQSSRAKFLFETGMPTRYYLPRADVEMELLAPTERRTSCPYKGDASYYSARIGSQVFEDVVWTYPDPVRESAPIKDYLCFYNDRVDAIEVDGTPIAKPRAK